jgi:hypothetical protein
MRALLLLLSLPVVSTAFAGERAGVKMPDSITVENKALKLNGMGLREATWLKIDVYVAGLYVENVSSNAATLLAANEVKQIVLRFKRDVDHDDIVKAWTEGFAHNSPDAGRLKPLITKLNTWMPSFAKGDTLTFTLVPGNGVSVDVNGKHMGTLGDDDFSRSLLAIWLGPKPPTGALKTGMLGRH